MSHNLPGEYEIYNIPALNAVWNSRINVICNGQQHTLIRTYVLYRIVYIYIITLVGELGGGGIFQITQEVKESSTFLARTR